MPEVRFEIMWPDGSNEVCYSPSSIVKKYFSPGESYPLEEFVGRSRQALNTASDRVEQQYGRPCGLALGQLQAIEAKASQYNDYNGQAVQLLRFI